MPETPPYEFPMPGMIFPAHPTPPSPPLPPREPLFTVSDSLPRVAPRRVLVAVAVVAVAAAVLLPDSVLGIGIALTGVTVLAAVFVGSPRRPSPWEILTAGGIVALLAVAGWRSAEWLAGWCILLALLTTGVLLIGGRSVRDMAFAIMAPITVSAGAAGWLYRAVAATYAGRPIRNPVAVVTVGAATIVLLVVFGTLFASADATFAARLDALTPRFDDPGVGWSLAFAVIAAAFTALGCYLRYARPRLVDRPLRPAGDTWMWAVPAGTVLAVYMAFLITQAQVMFGRDDYVRRTAGLTYADYARSGFWQLFAVTVLTLLVVSIAWQRARRDTTANRTLVRVVLGGLCASALVVVWSAIHRMNLYIDAYGATRLRISVMAAEMWLGAILIALIVAGIGIGTRQLPRVIGALTIGAALAFAVYNPDAQIARANVDRFEKTSTPATPGKIDVDYLSGLSPDATGALLRLPADIRTCVLAAIAADVGGGRGWTGFTIGRSEAKDWLRGAQLTSAGVSDGCPPQ